MIFQAHRGVSTENPENTMPAFAAAVRQGYKIIELDVSVTKDKRFVLLHDAEINRLARLDDGSSIPQPTKISDITYSEVLTYDFGMWFSKKFTGTKIALFEDVLEFARKNNVKLKIDNKYQHFSAEEKETFFKILKTYEDVACLTCSDTDEIMRVYKFFPRMHLHYDGAVTADNLEWLGKLLPKEQLTVWLPLKCHDTSWVSVAFADDELAKTVKKYARLGLWILSNKQQLAEAERLGADVIETNGRLKPELNAGTMADMHTHSENSHDSLCKIEDMLASQKANGTKVFAVTDHFDTASFNDYDVFAPIKNAAETVKELNGKNADDSLILSGIEISEGFWYPEVYKKVAGLAAYDVVIGSVHLVRYKNLTCAYSQIDFSKPDKAVIAEYADAYFDDLIAMLENIDFDILAHLTCPLRYITGKYKIDVDLLPYTDKIDTILRKIIQKGIALEVNTSSFGVLGNFMPPLDILKKYYDMGGYLLTLGSDAHVAGDASKCFDKAIKEIKKIGFENIFYYKNRNQIQITI